MGKGSDKRRTSAKRKAKAAKGRGIDLFAEARRPTWFKPPVERLYDRGHIDDTELWAARRFAVGYQALVAPMQPRAAALERVDTSRRVEAEAVERATVADDYKSAALAMDRADVAERRFRGFTREIVTAVCVCDVPLTRIEDLWELGHGSVLAHLKRGLRLYAIVCPPPLPPAIVNPPVRYGLSTSVA